VRFSQEQAASRVELEDGTVLTKCDQCIAMHNERVPPTEPPCDTCRVDLLKTNEAAADVYQLTCDQVRTRFNGEYDVVIGLDFNSVFGVMDRYPGGIKDQWRCFEKVRRVFYHFLRQEGAG